jgi:ribonuclease BN (tRNA processing enzyme)
MAQAAGVRRLVLTHYPERATVCDLDESARLNFSGDIVVADDNDVVHVTPADAAREISARRTH